MLTRLDPKVARDVTTGLTATPKQLPAYLFYDEVGSELYERITELEEYYPTRTERKILVQHAHAQVALMRGDGQEPLHLVELGAGSASKTTLILKTLVEQQGGGIYLPIDVSASALEQAVTRLHQELPAIEVRPFVGQHLQALDTIEALGGRTWVLFIGSSVGNLEDHEASSLLGAIGKRLRPGGGLLLGTDLRKSPAVLVPAYDDRGGVTAAFNLNMLSHINRICEGDFEPSAFRHVAVWNEEASRIEMHLESLRDQVVQLRGLNLTVSLEAQERIHTESSIKYDLRRVDGILEAAGFRRKQTFTDDAGLFGVHLAEVVSR
ncbi:MAG: L-histidine N(alpha)-methyltransferase [Myxococcota bacterium]